MKMLEKVPFRVVIGLGIAALSAPLWGAIPARPGMLNYVEGQAAIDGQQVTSKSIGSMEVERNQVLETDRGKAEMLLTPGVFLRIGDNSAVRMTSPELTNTSVELLRGEALVEVTQIYKENNIRVADRGTMTTLLKEGLYRFDADRPEVSVLDGKATVYEGDQHIDLTKGKEADLSGAMRPVKFDRKAEEASDPLYQWSSLRSKYLSEASASSARTYIVNGYGWYGGGWYWNPFFSAYTFLPGDGFFYSPFGYGFYSPRWVYYNPHVYRNYYRGGTGRVLAPPRIGGFSRGGRR
jgi:hypothetical protein